MEFSYGKHFARTFLFRNVRERYLGCVSVINKWIRTGRSFLSTFYREKRPGPAGQISAGPVPSASTLNLPILPRYSSQVVAVGTRRHGITVAGSGEAPGTARDAPRAVWADPKNQPRVEALGYGSGQNANRAPSQISCTRRVVHKMHAAHV